MRQKVQLPLSETLQLRDPRESRELELQNRQLELKLRQAMPLTTIWLSSVHSLEGNGLHPLLKRRMREEESDCQSVVRHPAPLLSVRVRRVLDTVKPPETHVCVWAESVRCVRSVPRERQQHEVELPVPHRELPHQSLHRKDEVLQPLQTEVEPPSVAVPQYHA